MNPEADSPMLAGCEAFQRQISDAADAGASLTNEIETHLRSCVECAGFANTWFPRPPAVLARPFAITSDDRLRERILDAASTPQIIPFPVAAERRIDWSAWTARIAACLLLTGMAWWLLDPTPTRVKTPAVAAADPTLGQSLAGMENRTKREQEILRTALADGGQHVRGDVEWTLSALEL